MKLFKVIEWKILWLLVGRRGNAGHKYPISAWQWNEILIVRSVHV